MRRTGVDIDRGGNMTGTIAAGSALPASSTAASAAATGLQAQLARYQKQLADCVDCASAKTPEGRKTIQELSDRISIAKERLRELDANPAARRPALAGSGENRESGGGGTSAASTPATSAGMLPRRPEAIYSTVGSALDVFA